MATMPTSEQRQESRVPALEESFFCISRAFYTYVTFLERMLEKHDLSSSVQPGMGHVLFALFESDDVIIQDLIERTQLSRTTLTRLVRLMDKQKLITRHRDPADARATRIRLTRKGRSLERKCFDVIDELRQVVEEGMSPRQVLAVKEGLRKMTRNMKSHVLGADA
jgi:DNA-binding MarR family transcriptional regulator